MSGLVWTLRLFALLCEGGDDGGMNHLKALGFLIVGKMSVLLTERECDDEDASYFAARCDRRGVIFDREDFVKPACCPECCGPCAALRWLRDNDPETANRALRLTGNGYNWQFPGGDMNWRFAEDAWSRAWQLNCCEMEK